MSLRLVALARRPMLAAGMSLLLTALAIPGIPLPFGFFITGMGGLVGVNRTLDEGALTEVVEVTAALAAFHA